jgi:hypothetical protein
MYRNEDRLRLLSKFRIKCRERSLQSNGQVVNSKVNHPDEIVNVIAVVEFDISGPQLANCVQEILPRVRPVSGKSGNDEKHKLDVARFDPDHHRSACGEFCIIYMSTRSSKEQL